MTTRRHPHPGRAPRGERLRVGFGAWVGVALLLAALLSPTRSAAEEPAWTHLHLKILMRALTYEHYLHHREGAFRLGVLFDTTRPQSVATAREVLAAISEQRMTFLGREVVAIGVPLVGGDQRLEDALDTNLTALYVTDDLAAKDVRRISELSRKRKIVTTTAVERYVVALGLTLASQLRDMGCQEILDDVLAQTQTQPEQDS